MGTNLFETDITAAVADLKTQAGDRWRVPEVLIPRTMEYYTRHAKSAREHLNKAAKFWELSPDTINAVLEDYARALFGVFEFTATRDQMEQLRALRSTGAFFVDRYGLYNAVLGGYAEIVGRLREYDTVTAPRDQYRGVTDQQNAQRAYINGPNYLADGRAVAYLIKRGEFDAGLFAGLFGPAEVNGYLDRCKLFASVYDYADYYTICKYCLNATAEELDQIPTPRDRFGDKTPQQFAEETGETITRYVQRFENELNELLAEAEAEPSAEAGNGRGRKTKTERGEIIRVPDTFAALLSRDVFYNRMGGTQEPRNENDILPIREYITRYLSKHPDTTGTTTPRIIEKTIEGVNLLQRNGPVKPVGGWYTYNTTLTDFAKNCGFQDPNGDELRGVLLSLLMLRELYLIVWKQDGLHAVNILNVPDIGVTGKAEGKIRIQVNTDATKGRPQLLTVGDLQRMRAEAKGAAENHFRYQIIAKGHKTENALLDEIFGYTNAIREATADGADPETIDGLKRNQQKNKPRDRQRLRRMFDKQQAAGFLTYKRYTNAKGETVYSWKRTGEPQEPDTQEPTGQDPNEQGPDEQ